MRQRINPPGFAFDHFDELGRWREDEHGLSIDTSGTMIGTEVSGEFTDHAELIDRISTSEDARNCMVKHWFRYAFGRDRVEADTFCADLADEAAVGGMVRGVLARFGRIDVLVNCAAVWESKPLEEVTAADVRFHFDINALGTFLCSQHAGLAMVKQPEGGLIVTIGDWAEVRPYLGYAAYFPSKGAVTAITRSLAAHAVRVSALSDGAQSMRTRS